VSCFPIYGELVLTQQISARQPPEMQKEILAELDKWVKMQSAEAESE
jgi:hypothetical protein